MQIGNLSERLEFHAPTRVSDGMGGFDETFVTMFTVWGSLWPLSGAEAVAAMQMGGTITGKVRIRYRSAAIPVSWRIKHGNSYLSIAAPPINLGGENKWLEIKVKEVT
jgi:SPP1 family predicted phage head-tail adaptor